MSSKTKTTATREEATPALVPNLRFPEFQDADGWAQLRLIDTADRSVKWSFIGGPFGSNLKSSDYVADGVRIIQLQNIGDGEFCADYRIFTSFEKADELLSNNIYPGDIIMSKMGDPVGRACLIPELHDRYVMCSDGIRLVVNEKENEKYFIYSLIYSLINSPPFRSVVEKTATGSTRKRIGLDELKNLPMWLPKKPEQQKIAECLSSVDELIAAQARKLDALKTHKKGLMQQLFPREGETQPHLRFSNEGDWIVVGLPEVAFFQEGPGIMAVDFRTEGVPLVRLAGVGGSVVTLDGCNYLDPEKVGQKWSHFRLAVNDLIISTSATFGLSSIVTDTAAGAVFYTGLIRFRPSSRQLDHGYLKTFLGSPHFERQAESAAVGGGIKHFGPSHIKRMEIPIPIMYPENWTED